MHIIQSSRRCLGIPKKKCEYTDETENHGGEHDCADSEERGGLKRGRHSVWTNVSKFS